MMEYSKLRQLSILLLYISILCFLKTKAQHHDLIHRSWSNSEGLRFRIEPGPSHAIFSNKQGLILKCSAVYRTTANNSPSDLAKSSLTSSSGLSSSSNIQIQWLRKTTISPTNKPSQTEITNVPVHNTSLLYIRPSDNSLVFNPFNSENFRNEIHLASYYCLASNHLGSIISREVQVQAIVEIANTVQINVYDEYVTRGSTTSLKCHIISNFKDYLQVNAWILNDGRRIEPIKQNSIDGYELNKLKMFAIYDQLIIVGVNQEDTFRTFRCEVRNLITNELIVSSTSGKIMITEPNNTPPIIQSTRSNLNLNVQNGKQVLLLCLANANPQPNYRWFYRSNVAKQLNQMGVHQMTHQLFDYSSDREQLVELNLAQHWKFQLISKTGILLIKNLTEIDSAVYSCVANNSLGQDQLEIKLTVKQKLVVQLNNLNPPNNKHQTSLSSTLDSINLKCNILSGSPINQIKWYFNGQLFNKTLYQENDLLTASSSNLFNSMLNKQNLYSTTKHKIIDNGQQLIINKFDSTSVGCYSCVVNGGLPISLHASKNDEMYLNQELTNNNLDRDELLTIDVSDSAQDAICFQLSEKKPVLKKVFSKTILKQGDKMSLRCVASGNPLPTVQWGIFDSSLPENQRIQYGDYVSLNGDVVSYVNISSVQVSDSGLWVCSASNSAGTISHREYIHVTGPLSIKPMRNQTALSGATVVLICPVLGYPFDFIRFSKLLKNDNPAITTSDSTSNLLDEVSIPNFNEEKHRLVPVKSSERYRVFDNGTLIINQVNRETDAGLYRCETGDSNNLVSEKMYLDIISKPTVSQFTFPSHLSQGMRIIITCNVLTGDPPIKIDWLHTPHNSNDPQLIVFNNINGKLLSNNNLERSDISEVGSSLVFRQVDTSHRGSYTCRVSNLAGEDQYTAVMTVKSQPKWVIEPKDQMTIVGETVNFNCQADGYPTPLIRWKMAKDSRAEFKSISSNYHIQTLENGSLTIKEVSKSDAGFYLCESGNGVGVDLAKVVQLQVFVKAHFKLSFDLFRVEKGSPLRLSCTAYGERPLTIRWLKERVEINPLLEKRYIVTEKETSDGLISELYASSASREDSSTFTCVASNSYGSGEQHNRVLVEETPDPPNNIEIAEYTHKSITLRYSQPYNGNKPILNYICQYKKHKDTWTSGFSIEVDGNTLQITVGDLQKPLQPLTTYNFRFYAVNKIGRSQQSKIIIGKTDEISPTSPPTNIRVEALSAKTIKVKWKQPKHVEQFGSITGYYIGYRISKAENQQYTFSTVELSNLEDYQSIQSTNQTQMNSTSSTNLNGQYEHVLINLKKATTYSIIVQAFNSKGSSPASSEYEVTTLKKDAPFPPKFRVLSVKINSATIAWSNMPNSEEITGIQIFIRGNDFETHEMVKSALNSTMPTNHTINNLKCGSKYQVYLVSFNEAGNSEPSEVQTFQTLGNVPIAPERRHLIVSNSSSALVKLSSFKPALCPINGFEIKYKLQQESEWIEISNLEGRFAPSFELIELKPASYYNLIVTANSEAGPTQVEYSFSTLTASGATIAPQTSAQQPNQEEQKLKKYIQLMLPVCSALIALIVIIVFLVFVGLKRNQNQHSTNSVCDALSTADHHLSQPNLLHLNQQQQNALQHVAHYTLSHHQNGHLNGKNDPVINSMKLISNGTNNKLIYEANLNQSNNAALHLQNNDTISNSIYRQSPYATYFFSQDNPINNCFLMTNELVTNNLNGQKAMQNNLNHHDSQNCYDMPMLKDGNRTGTNLIEISNEMFN